MIENPSEKDEIYLANVAKIGNSPSNIQYLKNVLSQEEHEVLLKYVKNSEFWNKTPWGSESIKSGHLPKNIFDMLEKVFTIVYEKSKSTYGVEIQPVEKKAIHLVKFPKGFYLDPHEDTSSDESLHIASVYYINEDYEGGEIVFPQHNLTIKPSPNSLIIFPGNENYVHQVIEIKDRPRYSSALWFQFTGSTFNKKREWFDNK